MNLLNGISSLFQPAVVKPQGKVAAESVAPEKAPDLPADDLALSAPTENWRVQSNTLNEAYEQIMKIQGQDVTVHGTHSVEDSVQTNIDTGEFIKLHRERFQEGDHEITRTDFAMYDAAGVLQAKESRETESLHGEKIKDATDLYRR